MFWALKFELSLSPPNFSDLCVEFNSSKTRILYTCMLEVNTMYIEN